MSDLTAQLLVLIPAGMFIIAVITLAISLNRSTRTRGEHDGKIAESLENINYNLKEIKGVQNQTETQLKTHAERITRVEESVKSAHKRIGELKGVKHD